MESSTSKAKPQVIILHETVLQSWLRDASTFALFVGLIGIGILLQSVAMQWIGAIIGMFCLATIKISKRLSFDGARKYIDEVEASL